MDRNDFAIISELIRSPLESFEKIGSKVKMSGVSVRSKILNMYESGFLQGVYLIPSPMIFDRYPHTFVFKNVENAFSKLPEISKASDVVFAWIDHENDTIVTVFCKSDKAKHRTLVKLSEIMEVSAITAFTPVSLLPPNLSSSRFSRIDWKIMEHISSNPRMSVAKVSRMTHLSRKTVRKHIDSMLSEKQLYPVYIPDFTKAKGQIFYGSLAIYETPEVLKQLMNLNLDPVWYMNEPLGAHLLGFAESLRDVELLKKRVEKIDGIISFSLSIPSGGVFVEKRVLRWIREAISKWDLASFDKS